MGNKDKAGPTFRPSREGLAKVLGELEAEVMEYVWSAAPEPVTARDVEEAVGEVLGVQYITLVTVLNNLCRKRLLKRTRVGRAFNYRPRLERDDFLRQVSHDVFSGMVDLGAEVAVTSFVDVLAELAPEEIERLKQKLTERVRKDKRK